MKTFRFVLSCIMVLPVISLHTSTGSLSTSISLIRDHILSEDTLIYALKHYCDELQHQINELEGNPSAILETAYLKSKKELLEQVYTDVVFQTISKRKEERLLDILHPTGAIDIINNISSIHDILNKILNIEEMDYFKKRIGVTIPTTEDRNLAYLSLVRLQAVYAITTSDIYKGELFGHKGRQLVPHEAMLVALSCLEYGYSEKAIEWAELALSERNINDTEIFKLELYSIIASSYFMLNKTKEGLKYLQKASRIDPFHVEVLKLLKIKDIPGEPNNSSKLLNGKTRLAYISSCQQDTMMLKTYWYHVCRYKMGYLPYIRYKEEVFSWEPYISLFYEVISDEEIEIMKTKASTELKRSRTIGGQTIRRSSSNMFLLDSVHSSVKMLSNRIGVMTGLNTHQNLDYISSTEPFQVVNYGIGGEYQPHVDSLINRSKTGPKYLRLAGDRIATYLIYLSDVIYGGATVFPRLRIKIPPIKKSALFWYGYPPSNDVIDDMTLHAGCPVVIGEKWVSNKWIWAYGNTFTRPCGLTKNHTQLQLECDLGKAPREFGCNAKNISELYQ